MKKMKRFIALALMAITLMAVTSPALAVYNVKENDYIVLTSDYVNFRKGPGTNYETISNTTYRKNTIWKVINPATNSNNQWYKINVPSYGSAYVRQDMCGMASAQAAANERYSSATFYKTGNWKAYFMAVQQDMNAYCDEKNTATWLALKVTPDGAYGNLTENLVLAVQRAFSLTADGIVGGNTKTKLYEWMRQENLL